MSLFVLRQGYRVVATPTGGRVVHVRTGDALEVSAEEIQLLARASTGGIKATEPGLLRLVRRLAALNLLVPAPAGGPAPATAAKPAPAPAPPPAAEKPSFERAAPDPSTADLVPHLALKIGPEEVVPLFRSDLTIAQRPSSVLFDVSDPASGKTFLLYDFEVSLARMLNGRRRYVEVVEAGLRVGIPVNATSLAQFVRQLDRYGFLQPPGTELPPKKAETAWAKRERWNDGIRTLFQSGLRLSRQGRYAEAVGYLEALLEQDPKNPEALELLEKVSERLTTPPRTLEPSSIAGPGTGIAAWLDEELSTFATAPPLAVGTVQPQDLPWKPEPATPAPASDAEMEDLKKLGSELKPDEKDEDPFAHELGEAEPEVPAGVWPVAAPEAAAPAPAPEPAAPAPVLESALAEPVPPEPVPPEPVPPAAAPAPVAAKSLEEELGSWDADAAEKPAAAKEPEKVEAPARPAAADLEPDPSEWSEDFGASGRRKRGLLAVLGLLVVGGGAAGYWYALRPLLAEEPAAPAPVARAPAPAPSPQRDDPGPKAEAAAAAPDAGVAEVVDAGAAAVAQTAPPDAVEETPAAAPLAGPSFPIGRRGRHVMGELVAPFAGELRWTAPPEAHLAKGEAAGTLKVGSRDITLKAPVEGLLMQRAKEGERVQKGKALANLVYVEAFLQAVVKGPRPAEGWACEVLDEKSGERAPCKVVSVAARGNGFFITGTTSPTWFDRAKAPRIRLAPP